VILPPQKGPPHNLCRTIPGPWLPHLTQAWIHEAVSLLPTQPPGISFFPPWALSLQAGMPLYTYTCLAWQHLMALGLTCSGTKKGRERKGRDRKRWICPSTVSQSTWTGPNPSNVMKPALFFFSPPHCPPASLPLPEFLFLLTSCPPSRVPMLRGMIPTLQLISVAWLTFSVTSLQLGHSNFLSLSWWTRRLHS